MNQLLELINSVKAASEYNEVELWGDKKSFDELMASGFPLGDFKCREFEFDASKIMVIPCRPKPIKLYFDGDAYCFEIK
jgi:hypothetical protein